MKIRFALNQAECFRRGIDAPKSIVTIDVNPADLPQEDRNLIADRLDGIDVIQLNAAREKEMRAAAPEYILIEALDPTLEGLLAAIRLNEESIMKEAAKPKPWSPPPSKR